MSNLSKIDKNFTVVSKIDKTDVVWYDASENPVEIYGACSKKPYTRMPSEIAEKVSAGVAQLNVNTAGIRARFRCINPESPMPRTMMNSLIASTVWSR